MGCRLLHDHFEDELHVVVVPENQRAAWQVRHDVSVVANRVRAVLVEVVARIAASGLSLVVRECSGGLVVRQLI